MRITYFFICTHDYFFLFICFSYSLNALTSCPADISFMVADLKYSRGYGVKICEIQHGFNSVFDEDVHLHGQLGQISPSLASFFTGFPMKKWASGVVFSPLALALSSKGWVINKSTRTLFIDKEFLALASIPPMDPTSIASYSAIHFCSQALVGKEKENRIKYPGVLFLDAATVPYWGDKYKMNLLFRHHPELEKIKPEWGFYECEYKDDLAAKITLEIPGDFYVLKPRGEMKGKGVIIVDRENLDRTLRLILRGSEMLQIDTDKDYAYWVKNRQDMFIVEKFYPSDPLIIPKISNRKKKNGYENDELATYDPTLRVAFLLVFDQGKVSCRSLGGYWRIPKKSLEEGGSLNEMKKDYSSIYHSSSASKQILEDVFDVIEQKIPLLYEMILESHVLFID